VKSPEFAAMWADHRVKTGGGAAVYEMCHPLVGAMKVTQQSLSYEGEQRIVVATTELGSPSHAAMTLLAHSTVTGRAANQDSSVRT
jgi:hypothetical protein